MVRNRLYAGIIIDQLHPLLDKIFHYVVPEELESNIQLGMRVEVSFGSGNRKVQGYVLQIDSHIDVPLDKIKSIIKILDHYPIIPEKLLPLIHWMKTEYHCMTIEAIRCLIPPGLRSNIRGKTQKVAYLVDWDMVEEHIQLIEKRSWYMAEILRILSQGDGLPVSELRAVTGAPLSSFKSLERRGWIRLTEEEIYRNPWEFESDVGLQPKTLTTEQQAANEAIGQALDKGQGKFLLQGVTGSGKTEVYIHSVEKALALNRQAIVLVPEISLTPQTVERFKNHFGQEVAILHSGLSLGERFDEWRRIRSQKVNIVVGTRSAVFAPLKRLGIIVIDEAQDDSYKSDMRPRYHAVGVAEKRCELEGGVLVLGSATPSIADYYAAQRGIYKRIGMKYRIDHRPLPPVEIVDMREEILKGNRSILSRVLYQSLLDVLAKGEQAILLLNRRGYAQFVSCRSCGFVVKCRNCDISLTYHVYDNILKCHYCGHNYPYPSICPSCKSKYIKHFGIGTQKVEEDIKKFFPQAGIVRMDMDTTTTKGAHQKILKAFRERRYDILLGTQMIAKGLDFPLVTLVGVIAADTSLNLPEYRSSEKTFQLITQVAGRTGRGVKGGKVIVQTYQPDNYAIQHASKHDYLGFYNEEIKIRRQFVYPPFSHIIRILMTGEKEKSLIELVHTTETWLKHQIEGSPILKQGLIEIGAYSAPLEKIKRKYRWQILLKIQTDSIYMQVYHKLMDECLGKAHRG
jgi:primosomal protein N' (replication factor Y)